MPNRVRDIQGRLDDAALKLENAIGILGSEYGPEHVKSVRRETSPLISEIEVFGRDEESNKVIEILLRSGTEIGLNSDSKGKNVAECSNKRRMRNTLSVLPIVGMGGVGKTTLAQFVYNDERVKGHFDLICWVCVSHNYDEKRIINEILESNHGRTRSNFTGLTALHENLRDSLMLKRFLIVLDDVWNENRRDWQSLCTPLRDGREGSMILVTTRSSEVAEITGTIAPIFLKGLACDIYWEFFKRCAFSSESSESHPELVEIGKKIAAKLNGSPLAAKTVGGLLSVELDAKHWNTILGSEIWKLKQGEFDILPALQLSYLYLPAHLKRCFAFCSMFPKNYGFEQERLVCMWVVNGLVSPNEGMLEDIGDRYLNELIRRSFLQPNPGWYKNFLLHDLMHDLSQSVSSSECLCIQSSDQIGKLSGTIRHLSVFCKPDELLEVRNMHKMHSLAFHQEMNNDRTPILGSWLRDIIKMTHLHMLILLMCNMEELPQSFGDLKHLGYLDLQTNPITELPESLCQIYGLQFLSIRGCPIRKLPGNFSKLINLKILDAENEIISRIPEIRKLTSLQGLDEFKISKENGREIMELKDN
ncbi:hypothetical protein LUZ60_005989 [Juncus effusus]|nr:hypothetical protein LUZ60_005989 [Juncus effusus]